MRIKNVIIGIMFLILLMSFVNAYYWDTYGSSFTPMWHNDVGGFNGRFDINNTYSSIATGYTLGSVPNELPYMQYEPLIWHFNTSTNYLIFPDGSNLQVYNSDLFLVEEISTGDVVSQIDMTDFSGFGGYREVAGIYEYNNTWLQFKTYRYNDTAVLYTETNVHNISVDSDYFVNGVRCTSVGFGLSGECYFTITETTGTTFYWVNTTDVNSLALPIGNELPLEPVAWLDTDSDGDVEFLVYTNETYTLFEKDGTIDVQKNVTTNRTYIQVKMFQPDLTNDWRFAVLEKDIDVSTSFPTLTLKVYKADGSTYWSDMIRNKATPTDLGGSVYYVGGRIAIVDDYGGQGADDGLDDIYVVGLKNTGSTGTDNSFYAFRVYQGYTGSSHFSWNIQDEVPYSVQYRERLNISFVTANMDSDTYEDFIFKTGTRTALTDTELWVVNGNSASILNYSHLDNFPLYSCVPADLDVDGFLDIICSGEGGTTFLSSGGVNTNSQIVSVAYSPSLSVGIGETLYAIVTANDSDGDTIFYREKCSNSESWSAFDNNATRSCVYGSVGVFNMSVAVKDLFHTDTDIFSQSILVTDTGTICDNDLICEAGQGETYLNCGDCPAPNVTQSSVNGSMPLPTQLVDVANTNQGLLPEIYYGTLGFMSSVLSPLIVLVFVILFVMIILTIGVIIRKIAVRVGSVGR
jgi:hypothetical protein